MPLRAETPLPSAANNNENRNNGATLATGSVAAGGTALSKETGDGNTNDNGTANAPASRSEVLAAIDESLRRLADTADRLVVPTCGSFDAAPTARSTTPAAAGRRRTAEEAAALHAPPGLERPFAQLYRALAPALLPGDGGGAGQSHRVNRSVFVQGPRGCGKSLLVQSCLRALVEEHRAALVAAASPTASATTTMAAVIPYRPVYLNAALHVPTQRHHPNAGAGAVVDEILRQLLAHCSSDTAAEPQQPDDAAAAPPPRKRQRTELLRLRRTNFTNHLQLLNEILQIAAVDDTPVLFVLDHVAHFPPLLLYHLLDRLAGASTGGAGDSAGIQSGRAGASSHSLVLVGMTSHALTSAQASGGFLEKRIVSRVEGTTSVVHLKSSACPARELLRSKLHPRLRCLAEELGDGTTASESTVDSVADVLIRQERLGQPARWFCRLFSLALATYREDLLPATGDDDGGGGGPVTRLPDFVPHVRDALRDLGVSVEDDGLTGAARRLDPAARQVLRDLSLPQLIAVLAARRIVARSHRRHHRSSAGGGSASSSGATSCSSPVVLTLQGIVSEVSQTLYRGNPPPNATPLVLRRVFLELLDLAVLRPALDHSGAGPWQYYERATLVAPGSRERAPDWDVLLRLPLHLTLDAHRDVLAALEGKVLAAPAAVLEWGKRIH